MQDDESVLKAVRNWDVAGELRLVNWPSKHLLQSSAGKVMKGNLQIRIKRTWRKLYVTCDATGIYHPINCAYSDLTFAGNQFIVLSFSLWRSALMSSLSVSHVFFVFPMIATDSTLPPRPLF